MAFSYVDASDLATIGLCIDLFRKTIPGYYDNMTLEQCVRKMTMKPPHMWMKIGRVDWTDAGQAKKMSVAIALHRREKYAAKYATQYYLSVGMSDPIESGDITGPGAISDALKAECQELDANVLSKNGHHNQMHLAYQETLDLSHTRLGPIFQYAMNNKWLGGPSTVKQAVANNGTTIVWPELTVRHLNY